MGKPLPQRVTNAEAAAVLRRSLRKVDRLAEAGALKKRKLSASRIGFTREDLEAYLGSLGDGYVNPVGSFSFSLPVESSLSCNAVAEKLDEILATYLPGCLVKAADGAVHVVWNAALVPTN